MQRKFKAGQRRKSQFSNSSICFTQKYMLPGAVFFNSNFMVLFQLIKFIK